MEPILGEIRMFGFGFPPDGWAECDGTILQVSQNEALFALIGATYGGDGQTSFALPDLRGRTPVHATTATPVGQSGGSESVTLSEAEMAIHHHVVKASSSIGDSNTPINHLLAMETVPDLAYRTADTGNLTALRADMVSHTGNGQPHPNMQPVLCVGFCIAVTGIFPSHN